jgi:hypothetical protein
LLSLAAHVRAALAAHAVQKKATPAAARQPAPHVLAAIARNAAGAPPVGPAGGGRPAVVLPKRAPAPPVSRSPRIQAPRVIQRATPRELTWERLLSMIRRLGGDGSPSRTEDTLTPDDKEKLELLVSEMGMSPPLGDYEVGATLSGDELEHAQFVSEAYSPIIAIILRLAETDDVGFNALSQSEFLKRFADIEPSVCNMQTAMELLACLAMIRARRG